jgi:hypothetical protein
MDVGTRVKALSTQADIDVAGEEYEHALAGELGTVIACYDRDWPTVEWEKSGTICDVHVTEVEVVSD